MAVAKSDKELFDTLNALSSPEELFKWARDKFGARAGIVTSFQDTGCVMIDMMSKAAPGMRVITVDTLRLPQETYELMSEIEAKYGLNVERFVPDAEKVERMIAQHGEYLFFDSKTKQEYCCNIRKVEPNQQVLDTLDIWFTGVRRDHSESRSETPRVQLLERKGRKLVKISPLVEWTDFMIGQYEKKHGVPRNKLYDQGYTSIGCTICTTPTLPHENKRAGRWRWFNHLENDTKECGIHTAGSGI